ncbi:MAG: type II secretion system protein GspG [Aquaticitalea sp.]
MDDIEFKPYDNDNLKRIGTGKDADTYEDKKPVKKKPRSFRLIIILMIISGAFLTYLWYQNNILHPKQTESELLDIRSALFLYKESFNAYPAQLTELTKGRPLRDNWLTDAWGNPYRYKVDGGNQTFVVTSAGSDGEVGTDDDIESRN